MTYRKYSNNTVLWQEHCKRNEELISQLNFSNWVFEKEGNFREFATNGTINSNNSQDLFDFEQLGDKMFWKLFDFIQNYFDKDASLFDQFEKSRINRKEIMRQGTTKRSER